MPTIASSVLPPPKSWDEFEDITLAAAKLRWKRDEFQRNGRTGQKQDGVDVFGNDDEDRPVGLQCKNTVGAISLSLIEMEVRNAEAFVPALDRLYIATTAKRDAVLQKDVRVLSEERRESDRFSVYVLFWDDICLDLVKNEDILFSYYPQYRVQFDSANQHDIRLYRELTKLLNSDGVIGFLDRTNMAGFSFPSNALDPLLQFLENWSRPEYEFISPKLESLRIDLCKKAGAYLEIIAMETFPTRNVSYQTVPPEWEHDQPDRFKRVVDKLHALAGEIVSLHTELVRTGRKELVAVGS